MGHYIDLVPITPLLMKCNGLNGIHWQATKHNDITCIMPQGANTTTTDVLLICDASYSSIH
jgi:hypothetical protein